ncbi:D-glucose-1-phosphatase [compost metagenome]
MTKSSKTVEKRFEEAIRGAKIASFDMFDTLVQRTVHPSAVQRQVVIVAADESGLPVDRVQELRHVAWEMTASASSSQGLDHEGKFSDWMRQWAWLMSIEPGAVVSNTEKFADRLTGLEIRLEGETLRANHDVSSLVKTARSAGLRVVVTSDMYLEKKHLAALLNNVGIYADEIFVSSEYGMTKRSGRLFRRMAETLGASHGEIVHIGDNIDADIEGAAKANLGITAIRYDKPDRLKRMRQKEFAWSQFSATGEAGELIRIAAEDGSADLRSGFIGYGHDVFGPAISTFVKRVAEIAEEREIDKVYFMAREGFLLKMIYELYQKAQGKAEGTVPAGYLCVSRLTTLKVTSSAYGLREMALGTVHAQTSIRKALGSLLGNDEQLARIAANYGFEDLDTQFDQCVHPMFHLLLRDEKLNETIISNRDAARAEMERYLESISFFDDANVLLVDVGWAGQIQESFDTFLKDTGRPVNVYGAYLATNHAAELRRAGRQILIPVIADRNKKNYYVNSMFRNVDLLETICRAPHGSVIGYRDGAPIEASGEKRSIELADDPMLSQMQKGVALYAANYFRIAKAYGITSRQTMSTAVTSLLRLHRFPETQEARVHQAVGHVASHWIGEKSEQVKVTSLRSQFRATHWKEGFVRERFGLLGLMALSLISATRREWIIAPIADAAEIPLRSTLPIHSGKIGQQEIEIRATQAFTENWLRSDIDDKDVGRPFLRDRHIAVAAILARLHALRNGYKLETPETASLRYAAKRKLFVEYPQTRMAILKARAIAWRLKKAIKG